MKKESFQKILITNICYLTQKVEDLDENESF